MKHGQDEKHEFLTLKNSGNVLFEKKNYEEAIEKYTVAISIIENNPEESSTIAKLLSNRSAAYLSQGRHSLALIDAERCALLDPHWPKAYYRIGMALKSLHKYQSSLEAFQRGLGLLEESSQSQHEFTKQISSLRNVLETRSSGEETVEGFFDMLNAEGCKFSSILIRNVGQNYRGVYTTSSVHHNSEIMRIPQHLLITVEMGMACPFGKQVFNGLNDRRLTSPKHTSLVLYIVWDRNLNPNSRFQSYYSLLPTSFPTCPIFWTEEDLYMLLGSHLLILIEERKTNISSDYSEVMKKCPRFSTLCSLDEFLLLRMIVASRNFSIEMNGIKTEALVPMADMMNHRRPRDTTWFYDNFKGSFIVQSLRNLDCGEEVFDSYGKKCNSRYLLNYGFTVLNNRDSDGTCYNQCCIEIGLDPSDPSFSAKVERLDDISKSAETSHRMVRLTLQLDDPETIDAFCYGRFICASSQELAFLPNPLPSPFVGFSVPSSATPGIIIPPLSLQTELKVLLLFKTVIEEQLTYYLTSLEEDNIRHSNLAPYSNDWNACNVLIGEKEICYFYLHLYTLCCEFMTGSISSAIETLKERHRLENQNVIELGVTEYLEKICLPLMIKHEQISHHK